MANTLGFGMMRLPVSSNDLTDFDYDQINQMVDDFLAAGYTYFDTSYVYHNGESETAVRKALVERYPRDAYTLATKFPTFNLPPESAVEGIFAEQLEKCGVDYFDYYLLHNLQNVYYDGIDGSGGIVQSSKLFEHALGWKEQGKIKHLGISFHSSAKLLDRILSEHPEIEFVQLAINYYDWESPLVQARKCYEVMRAHGLPVVVMEPVKGGGLATAPAKAEELLAGLREEGESVASVAMRFCLGLEGVITVLSGMSSVEQVRDNIATSKAARPLADAERAVLPDVVAAYKQSGPLGAEDFSRYEGVTVHGVSVSALLDAYNTCQIQPDPGFSCDNNYVKNAVAEGAHLDFFGDLPQDPVVLPDGTDVSELVYKCEKWLIEHSF